MDGGDCTDGNRRGFFNSFKKYSKNNTTYMHKIKKSFFRRGLISGRKVCELCLCQAFLRSFGGYRYAFLHFRRLLT